MWYVVTRVRHYVGESILFDPTVISLHKKYTSLFLDQHQALLLAFYEQASNRTY